MVLDVPILKHMNIALDKRIYLLIIQDNFC